MQHCDQENWTPMPIANDIRVSLALAIFISLLGGCASQHPVNLSIPFRYEGLGAGANDVRNEIVLPVDRESTFISRAIVNALQELEFSVVEPDVELGSPLPQGKQFTTDTVPIRAAVIADHNIQHEGEMSLPPRFYSLRYHGAYRLVDRDLVFELTAELYERAAATTSRLYTKSYSANFFIAPLGNAIKAKLQLLGDGGNE